MHKLKKQLQGLQNTQSLNRKKRLGSQTPIVCLVGYTNAGKSTLFNRLTNNDSLVMDQLFATLDPLSRKSWLIDRSVVFTDTVGFMRDLPDALITAFRATLDEIVYADLLLHVVDCSDPDWADKIRVVEETLSILSCDHIPTLLVCNKADLVEQAVFLDGVPVSAISGEGIGGLADSILRALPALS
jgi:GTP-binding protein HflX